MLPLRLRKHGLGDGTTIVVGAAQVGIDDTVPLIRAHRGKQSVANHAGGIDQDVELLPGGKQIADDLLGQLAVGDVGLDGANVVSLGFQFSGQVIGGLLILMIEKSHACSLGREALDAGAAYAATAAGDERCFSL